MTTSILIPLRMKIPMETNLIVVHQIDPNDVDDLIMVRQKDPSITTENDDNKTITKCISTTSTGRELCFRGHIIFNKCGSVVSKRTVGLTSVSENCLLYGSELDSNKIVIRLPL